MAPRHRQDHGQSNGPDSLAGVDIFRETISLASPNPVSGEPRLTHTGFDWGDSIQNLWVGALRSATPNPSFDVDELRVSTEGGDPRPRPGDRRT